MSKQRITRADMERAKNPLSLMSVNVDVHVFKPVRLAKDVVVVPSPTVGDLAKNMLRRRRRA